MKTLTKTLEPGKWRIRMPAGNDVAGVRLKGLRHRGWDLKRLSKEEFAPYIADLDRDTPIRRGVPNSYLQDGPYLMLWPAPAHSWSLEIDTKERVKV